MPRVNQLPKDIPIADPEIEGLGPAMLALTPMMRRFVVGWIATSGKDASRVARAAGYANSKHDSAKVKAFELLRNKKIIRAIHEEAGRRLDFLAIQAVFTLERNMKSRNAKAAQAAADSVLDRTGYPRRVERAVEVTDNRPQRGYEQLLTLVSEKLKLRSTEVAELPAPQVVEGNFNVVQIDAASQDQDERARGDAPFSAPNTVEVEGRAARSR